MKKLWLYLKRFWKYLKRLFSTEEQVNEIIEEIKKEAENITVDISTNKTVLTENICEPVLKSAIEEYKEKEKYPEPKFKVREIVAQPYVTGSVRNFSRAHPGRQVVYGSGPIAKKKS